MTIKQRLEWAEKFVNLRMKLLDLVSVDSWIHELLEMVQDVERETGITGFRERLLERIRMKMLGIARRRGSTRMLS